MAPGSFGPPGIERPKKSRPDGPSRSLSRGPCRSAGGSFVDGFTPAGGPANGFGTSTFGANVFGAADPIAPGLIRCSLISDSRRKMSLFVGPNGFAVVGAVPGGVNAGTFELGDVIFGATSTFGANVLGAADPIAPGLTRCSLISDSRRKMSLFVGPNGFAVVGAVPGGVNAGTFEWGDVIFGATDIFGGEVGR